MRKTTKAITTILIVAIAFSGLFFATANSNNAYAAGGYYKYFGQEPTAKEKKLMRKNPSDAAKVYNCSKTATEYTIKYYGQNGWMDNSDAFRHCLWSALIKKKIGTKKAKQWTDAHEQGDKKSLDTQMDLYNNKVGRSVKTKGAKTSTIAKRVKKKVTSGKCRRVNAEQTALIPTDTEGLIN